MGKQLDKDMLRMMTITERFNYLNNLKQMQMSMNKDPKPKNEERVDRDDDGGYDSSSDSRDENDNGYYDDSNEY